MRKQEKCICQNFNTEGFFHFLLYFFHFLLYFFHFLLYFFIFFFTFFCPISFSLFWDHVLLNIKYRFFVHILLANCKICSQFSHTSCSDWISGKTYFLNFSWSFFIYIGLLFWVISNNSWILVSACNKGTPVIVVWHFMTEKKYPLVGREMEVK